MKSEREGEEQRREIEKEKKEKEKTRNLLFTKAFHSLEHVADTPGSYYHRERE